MEFTGGHLSGNMDLEDGELPSSEDERVPPGFKAPANSEDFPDILDDTDYVILDRPKSSFTASGMPQVRNNLAPQSVAQNQPPPNQITSSFPVPIQNNDIVCGFPEVVGIGNSKKSTYHDLGIADLIDSSDKDSSSDNDSDDEKFGKRSRMIQPKPNSMMGWDGSNQGNAFQASASTSASSFPRDEQNMFNFHAAKFQTERKPNLIWSNVIQEEQISTIFEGVKVEEPGVGNIEVTRGPETYTYQRQVRPPRERRDSDSSDISSGGLSDNTLHYLRDGINGDEMTEETSISEHALPKSFTAKSTSKAAHARKTTKRKKNKRYKQKLISKMKSMKSPDLASYMANKLDESKVELLQRAVEILGKDSCIHIFLKTLKIQRRGGVLVKNQERRRTAGGVFLYLIRGDRRFPKSQIDLIFVDDRQFFDKYKKQKKATRRLQKKTKMETMTSELANRPGGEESDVTAVVPDEDGTDTGHYGDDSTQESSVHERDYTGEELGHVGEMLHDG